jgi:cysteine-rich repeat protein
MRLPFDQWGGFRAETTRCQRVIAREGARCAAATWAARRACRSAEVAGTICDHQATDALIATTRNRSLDAIESACGAAEQTELRFLGLFDLEADVVDFCRGWETEAASAVFGPFQGSLPPVERACVGAAAAATDGVMRLVFRNRRLCMDRIAALPLQSPKRGPLLALAEQRVASAYAALVARLTARCGAAEFAALYGRTPRTFVDDLGARADCIGGKLYIQDAVLCPAPVCGNGIVELPEDCDDANTADGDACPATCRR